MLFTVVIPVYNSSLYITETLKSIEDASKESNYEVLLIDDCSSDIDNLKIVINSFDKVKLIEKEKKSNAADSRNIGYLESKSRFVFFLDSDDCYISNAIDKRIGVHKACQAGVIFGNFIMKRNDMEFKSELPCYAQEDLRDYILIKRGDARSSVLSIDKEFHKCTLFDGDSQKHQDWIFIFRCWDNQEKIVFDDNYSAIVNVNSSTRMSASLNTIASKYFCENYLKKIDHINNFSKKNWKSMIYNRDHKASKFFLSIYRPQNISEYISYMFYKVLANKFILPLTSIGANIMRDKMSRL